MFGFGKKKTKFPHADKLVPDAVTTEDGWLHGSSGLPASADSLAYEPVQKLLAVGTWDGRVKLYGKQGVETTLHSACKYSYGSKQLELLTNRGLLVRLSEGGFLETWLLSSGKPAAKTAHLVDGPAKELTALKLDGDQITCFACLRKDPFIVLGCSSGAVRFAGLVGPHGSCAQDLKPPADVRLLPYKIPGEQLKAGGEVVAISTRSTGPIHHLLCLHDNSGLAVWDIRCQALLAHLNPRARDVGTAALRKGGKICSAAWLVPLAPTSPDFATGHDTGDILIWKLAGPEEGSSSPTVQCKLRVSPSSASGPVRCLKALGGKRPALLVVGGQEGSEEQAESGMALVAIPQGDGADPVVPDEIERSSTRSSNGGGKGTATLAGGAASCKLPWDGRAIAHTVVPSQPSIIGFEDAGHVMQLTDSWNLAVHDVSGPRVRKPLLLSAPGVSQGDVTCTAAVSIPVARKPTMPGYAVTLAGLRDSVLNATGRQSSTGSKSSVTKSSTSASQCPPCVGLPEGGWQGPLVDIVTAGQAPKTPQGSATIYCTGYKTGHVYLWDVSGDQALLVAVAPSDAAAATAATAKAVTAIDMVHEHGMLVTGHAKGEIRVYQFGEKGRQVEVSLIGGAGRNAKTQKISEEPGMQLRIRSTVHTVDITACCYAPAAKAVIAGDKEGHVSMLDMTGPSVLWCLSSFPQPVACLCLATLPDSLTTSASRTKTSNSSKKKKGGNSRVEESEEEDEEGYGSVEEVQRKEAVLLVNADSSLALLSSSDGQPLGKSAGVQPKNQSEALFCELLDTEFNPMWMSTASKKAAGKSAATAARGTGKYRKATAGGEKGDWRSKLRGHGRVREDSDDSGYSDDDSTDDDSGDDDDGNGRKSSAKEASYVLLASDKYIRIYSLENVITGDRTCAAKQSTPHPLVWACTFQIDKAPGLLALAQPTDGSDPIFLMYSLPSLTPVCEHSTSYAFAPVAGHVGMPCVSWPCPPSAGKARRGIAASRRGEVLALADNNELLRLHVSQSVPSPAQASSLYDWELSQAAHAASSTQEATLMSTLSGRDAALRQQQQQQQSPSKASRTAGNASDEDQGDSMDEDGDDSVPQQQQQGQKAGLHALDFRKHIGGVFSKVTQGVTTGVTRVYEGTTKGIVTVAKGVEQGVKGVGKLFVEDGPDVFQMYNQQHPDLLQVLGQVPKDSDQPRRRRHRASGDDDDGIPVTTPQPLVLPATSHRPTGTGTAAGGDGGSGGGGISRNASIRSKAADIVHPDESDADSEEDTKHRHSSKVKPVTKGDVSNSRRATRNRDEFHDDDDSEDDDKGTDSRQPSRGKADGKSPGKGFVLGSNLLSSIGSKRGTDTSTGGGPKSHSKQHQDPDDSDEDDGSDDDDHRVRKNSKADASRHKKAGSTTAATPAAAASKLNYKPKGQDSDDDDDPRQGAGAAGTGQSSRAGSGGAMNAQKLAQDMKTQLFTGAQFVASTFKGVASSLAKAVEDDDDDDEQDRRGNRAGNARLQYTQDAAPVSKTDEIRARYGRPPLSSVASTNARTRQVRDEVLEARSKLVERGEKIERLDRKAADIQEDAVGFADLARQVAEQQKNRKWWQV